MQMGDQHIEQDLSTLQEQATPKSAHVFEGGERVHFASDKSCRTMICTKHRVAAGICCTCAILISGIVCLVLYLLGYFTVQAPAISIYLIKITDVQIGYHGQFGPMLEFLDSLTGGAISNRVPSQAMIKMEMIVEINNTNPYDITVEQIEEIGTVAIPACVMYDNCENKEEIVIITESEDDLMLATWEIPDTILESYWSIVMPVSVTFTFDLRDVYDLTGLFVSGGPLTLRIQGGIKAKSWIPGVGVAVLWCLAEFDDIHNFREPPNVKCGEPEIF
jgi:hypothetical protein